MKKKVKTPHPPSEEMKSKNSFLFKGGYKDGKAGLVYCGLNAFYKYVTIAKIWEMRVRKEDIDPELIER